MLQCFLLSIKWSAFIFLPIHKQNPSMTELCSLATLFHEKYAQMKGNKLRFDPLEEQVEAAANKIEDLIEKAYASCGSRCSESSDPKDPGDETTTNSSYSQEFFQLTQEISSLTEIGNQSDEVYHKMMEEDLQQQGSSTADYVASFIKLNIMSVVGLDSEVVSLLDWFRRDASNLGMMAVVGDTSTCESTLVQIYTHPSIQSLFEPCLWVTVGQHYDLRELTLVLNDMGLYIDKRCEGMGNISLVDHLYGVLSEKRYLIILHDVRRSEMWDLFKPLLPNDWTGSRIILTTSLSNVADDIGKEFNKNWQGLPPEIPSADDAVSFSPRFSEVCRQIKLVGLQNEVRQLLQKVVDHPPICHIVSIVGMVGIGKTALMKQVYDNSLIQHHFDCRLFMADN